MVSDFLSWFTEIGSATKHAFISDDAHCKVINWASMILTSHYFRRHVTRRAWSVLCIILTPNSGNTKVCDAQVTITLYDEVLWLDISVYNILVVDVLETSYETCDKKSSCLLVEFTISANVVAQITSWQVVHNQVKVLSVLESVVHIDYM